MSINSLRDFIQDQSKAVFQNEMESGLGRGQLRRIVGRARLERGR